MPNLRGTGTWELAASGVTSGTISTGSVAEYAVADSAPAETDSGARIAYHSGGAAASFTGNGTTNNLYYRAPVDAVVRVSADAGSTEEANDVWPTEFDVHIKMPVDSYKTGDTIKVEVKQNGELGVTPVFSGVDDGGAVAKSFTAGSNGLWSATYSSAELDGDLNLTVTATDAFGNAKADTAKLRYQVPVVAAPLVTVYTTDPDVISVDVNGWEALFDAAEIPAEFDPVGSAQYLSVLRSGFDNTGTPTTIEDGVLLMKRIRQPYPAEASLTAADVALSDFIYSTDAVTGVTMNSTRVAPVPVCRWLTPDLRIAPADTCTVQLAVAHAHGRDGKPVAAVKFQVTDGSNTVEAIVANPTGSQFPGSGLYAPYYGAAIDVSSLDDGLLEIDAIVYPFVGAAYQLSVDAETYPSMDTSILKMWKNSGDTYGRSYVDVTVGGDDGTGTASGTEGGGLPFATYGAAMLAAEARNLAQYAREDIGGTVIRFGPGTHSISAVSPFTVNYGTMPITFKPIDSANKATTILTNPASSMRNGLHHYAVFEDLTIDKSSDNFFIDNQCNGLDDLDHHVEFNNVSFTMSGGAATFSGFFYEAGRIHCTNVDVAANFSDALGADNVLKSWTLVGCDVPFLDGSCRAAIATRVANCEYVMEDGGAGLGSRPAPVGPLFLNCYLTRDNDSDAVIRAEDPIGAGGFALIGTVVEKQAGTSSSPALRIGGDSDTSAMENVLLQHVTVVGSRTNFLYNDTGNAVKSGYVRGSLFLEMNTKSDVFGTDGTYIGNWPVIFRTGYAMNTVIQGSQAGDVPGAGEWIGEVVGRGSTYGTNASPIDADFVDDQSGAGSGDSDLTPGPSNALAAVEGDFVSISIDMKGRSVPVDGSALSGALQSA